MQGASISSMNRNQQSHLDFDETGKGQLCPVETEKREKSTLSTTLIHANIHDSYLHADGNQSTSDMHLYMHSYMDSSSGKYKHSTYRYPHTK